MKRIILSILFAGFSASVFAQMTLETCQELAREHYPEVKQYDLIHLTEQYDLSNAARGLAASALAIGTSDMAKRGSRISRSPGPACCLEPE